MILLWCAIFLLKSKIAEFVHEILAHIRSDPRKGVVVGIGDALLVLLY